MVDLVTQYWWTWALRGVSAVLFGAAVLIWPGAGVAVLVGLFGAYALVSGIFALIGAAQTRQWNPLSWAVLIDGLLGIAAGVVTFVWPAATALALLYIIGFWALLSGIIELFAAFRFHRALGTGDSWLVGLGSAASVVFGIVLFARPGTGAVAVISLIGIYAIIFGIVMLMFGFRLRSVRNDPGLSARRGLQHAA
jgi:uncharacterized membrane protein HdeD (DUF308 family)